MQCMVCLPLCSKQFMLSIAFNTSLNTVKLKRLMYTLMLQSFMIHLESHHQPYKNVMYQRHVLSSAGVLNIRTHVAIQVVYCRCMLIPCGEYLWYIRMLKYWHFCLKQEGHSIEWAKKGQAVVLSLNIIQYNRFLFRQWSPLS